MHCLPSLIRPERNGIDQTLLDNTEFFRRAGGCRDALSFGVLASQLQQEDDEHSPGGAFEESDGKYQERLFFSTLVVQYTSSERRQRIGPSSASAMAAQRGRPIIFTSCRVRVKELVIARLGLFNCAHQSREGC